MTRRTLISAWVLGALLLLVFVAVLVTPAVEQGTPYSSYSAGANGLRLSHDLVSRLGWKPEKREVPFSDSIHDPAPIQVIVEADLSDRESADLLAFARGGGAVLIAGNAGSIRDSLGIIIFAGGRFLVSDFEPHCESRGTWRSELAETDYAASIGWNRPPPMDTVGFGFVQRRGRRGEADAVNYAAVGLPYGAGRIVVIGDQNFLANDVVRRCELRADADFIRMIEYLSKGQRGLRVAFDEYHHGYGTRGGSLAAIRMYLSGTASGRMLAQIAVGGLLLLFAAAPRPLAPRNPSPAARRSPLEHADALAHAYASVNATRTATQRLLAGVRRRARGRSRPGDRDDAFLATVSGLSPAAARAAETVAVALDKTIPSRELPDVASALETIERELTRRPSAHR